MRKTILISLVCITTTSYASTMCVRNNTYVGTLRNNVNGVVSDVTNGVVNGNQKKQWAVTYDYKTITGYAACNGYTGNFGVPLTNLDTGARNAGQYCWCQMWPIRDKEDLTHYNRETGITSYWVFLNDYSTSSSCGESCTSACANAMATNERYRTAVFESVW